eukprot:GCRY01004199.1.p1 GENE.GCRY01004199.1~~GCRY01004199.1.p1  ORF type:complete len:802 (-),score=241.10 GCRY01004199.1:84-2489(-)
MSADIYFYSHKDVQANFCLQILALEGLTSEPFSVVDPTACANKHKDFSVSCTLYTEGMPLTLEETTSHGSFEPNKTVFKFNEWLDFGVPLDSLPLSTVAVLTVLSGHGPGLRACVGSALLPIYSPDGKLFKDKQVLYLHPVEPQVLLSKVRKGLTLADCIKPNQFKFLEENTAENDTMWLDALISKTLIEDQQNAILFDEAEQPILIVSLPAYEHSVFFDNEVWPEVPNDTSLLIDPLLSSDINPSEAMYRKIERLHHRVPELDRQLRPNTEELHQLDTIVDFPITKELLAVQQDLVWKYRFSLTSRPKALAKFLKCVDWASPVEAKQALAIMKEWAPISTADALELLGPSFTTPEVRAHAVQTLQTATDNQELDLYLLQLVQAIRFEPSHTKGLAPFLLKRATEDTTIGQHLFWYLEVEAKDLKIGSIYSALQRNLITLLSQSAEGKSIFQTIQHQVEFMQILDSVSKQLRQKDRAKRIDELKMLLKDPSINFEEHCQGLVLPLFPTTPVEAVFIDKTVIFKSATKPIALFFKFADGVTRGVMIKYGDDLRQDQLVVQMFRLMDQLLKRDHFDLCLTPYPVIAMSETSGMLELVAKCEGVETIRKAYSGGSNGSIQNFLRHYNYDPVAPYHIRPEVMDAYIKSCAGYCVMTYLLGIGDRHLDNLLLTQDGRFFHIDFGYILGHDPKPFPPPMKLCKEMVEGMGGKTSEEFSLFLSQSCEAFSIIRSSSALILNLFSLMTQSTIQSIAREQGDVILTKIEEKFKFGEEALPAFKNLMNDSVNALFPVIVDQFHRWAQYWRS